MVLPNSCFGGHPCISIGYLLAFVARSLTLFGTSPLLPDKIGLAPKYLGREKHCKGLLVGCKQDQPSQYISTWSQNFQDFVITSCNSCTNSSLIFSDGQVTISTFTKFKNSDIKTKLVPGSNMSSMIPEETWLPDVTQRRKACSAQGTFEMDWQNSLMMPNTMREW